MIGDGTCEFNEVGDGVGEGKTVKSREISLVVGPIFHFRRVLGTVV